MYKFVHPRGHLYPQKRTTIQEMSSLLSRFRASVANCLAPLSGSFIFLAMSTASWLDITWIVCKGLPSAYNHLYPLTQHNHWSALSPVLKSKINHYDSFHLFLFPYPFPPNHYLDLWHSKCTIFLVICLYSSNIIRNLTLLYFWQNRGPRKHHHILICSYNIIIASNIW